MTVHEPPVEPAVLLDVNSLARLLGCSPRHVLRMTEAGRMPQPVRLGALVRWPRVVIEEWIAGGCKPAEQRRHDRRAES